MSIATYLAKLARGVSTQGILGPSKGGTGVSAPGAAGNVLVSDGTNWASDVLAGSSTANIGYANIPQNIQSTDYTLVLSDSGKHIFHPASDATARTFTIPASSSVDYPIGTALSFVNMTSQKITIAINTDTMYLSTAGTTGSRTLDQYGAATALKITANSWLISGSGLT